LIDTACRPFDAPATRNLLKDLKQKSDIVIDEITTDELLGAAFDQQKAEQTIGSFKEFMAQNRDQLTALQILYNQPQGRQRLTYAAIRELVQRLTDPPRYLTTATVWQAYKRLDAARVRGAPVDDQLTEVVSLVRYALGQSEALEPFGAVVERRFNLWLGREKKPAANTARSRSSGCAPSPPTSPPTPKSPRATFRRRRAWPTAAASCRPAACSGRD